MLKWFYHELELDQDQTDSKPKLLIPKHLKVGEVSVITYRFRNDYEYPVEIAAVHSDRPEVQAIEFTQGLISPKEYGEIKYCFAPSKLNPTMECSIKLEFLIG